jgi:hypothetical protein
VAEAAASAASALTEVREVIEAYRSFDVVVSDWSGRLTAAVAMLEELAVADLRGDAVELAARLESLISAGLSADPASVESVAHLTVHLLDKLDELGLLGFRTTRLDFPTLTT